MSLVAANPLALGLATGVTYVLSIGPNNLTIIREALRRGRVFLVASVMMASYVALLLAAHFFDETVVAKISTLRVTLTWAGLCALFYFSFLSFRSAFRSCTRRCDAAGCSESASACIRRSLEIAWLNPLMYVEFLIIPAAFNDSFAAPTAQLEFMAGLIIMALVCCYGYAGAGALCAAMVRHQRMLQAFDIVSGVLLGVLGSAMGASLMFGPAL